jgi:hypothetical protein
MSDDAGEEQELHDRLERIDAKAQSLKADITGANEKFGYIAESVETFKKGYEYLLNRSSMGDDARPALASGIRIASVIEHKLDDMRTRMGRLNYAIDVSLPIFAASANATVTSVNSFAPETTVVEFRPYPFAQNSDMESYARKLSALDPSLGATYRGAWNVFYTQQHDPKRAALFQMRQVYDHLLEKLAPDDEVRQSAFWSEKPGDEPSAVHRQERLHFAANRCISDDERRTALLESVNETLRAYARLQEAHKRGSLSVKNASEAFMASDSLLRRWIDAADQWPPK